MIQLNIEISLELKTRYKIAAERLKIPMKELLAEILESHIEETEKFCDEMDKMY